MEMLLLPLVLRSYNSTKKSKMALTVFSVEKEPLISETGNIFMILVVLNISHKVLHWSVMMQAQSTG